jgi:hypothetical protein
MKKDKKSLKSFVLIVLLLILGLAACQEEEERVCSPFGIWQGPWIDNSANDFTINVEYADGAFTETLADIPETFSCTFSGTYVHDSAAKTITITVTATSDPSVVDVGYTVTSTYSISADCNTMTVTTVDGSGTFTRQ